VDHNDCRCCGTSPCVIQCFEIQADSIEPVVSNKGGQNHETKETVQFLDEQKGLEVGYNLGYDGISAYDETEQIGLTKFLSRPVRIASFTWNESDAVGTSHTYSPWNLFFNDTRIKYKLNNFAFIQCKLKVKVLINASPFYFGALYMGYQPLPTLTPTTIVNDSGTRYFIPYSQRPHLWIYPQNSEAGTMTLPFFYQKNWINIQKASDLTEIGLLTFLNYTVLASANGVTGTGVSVQVFAWAEDVKLSGPSIGLAMQSDEYDDDGPVSKTATAVASVSKYLENIPIIGRFVTATTLGATAIGSIARLFGFTDVPVISNILPYKPSPFPNFATSDIGYPVEKLTFDPKNELTVDPSVLGIPAKDEMVIANLVTHESYLCTASWVTSNAVDDILFSSVVCPALYDNDGATDSKLYMIPMYWISQLFNDWRGDIIFRFRIIATPFHKGRLRISYDPSGYTGENIISDSVSSSVVFTQIIDIGKDSDVEVRIPYQQATAFQQIPSDTDSAHIRWSTSASPTFQYNNAFDNGSIVLRVQTALTAPVATSTVPILIFVRGADNLEFANPRQPKQQVSTFQVQSDEIVGDPQPIVAGTSVSTPHDERYLINFGESIKSLRQIMRRKVFFFCYPTNFR